MFYLWFSPTIGLLDWVLPFYEISVYLCPATQTRDLGRLLLIRRFKNIKMSHKKVCFVPVCPNTSELCNKLFLRVPHDLKIRRIWWETTKVKTILLTGKNVYCCEDHFDLESDTENWMYFKTIGSKLILKGGVLPHKFIDSAPDVVLPSAFTDSAKKEKQKNLQNPVESPFPSNQHETTLPKKPKRKLFADETEISLQREINIALSPSSKFTVIPFKSNPALRSFGVQVNLRKRKMRSISTNT